MASRLKSPTLKTVPQSKTECAEYIRQVGDLQREFSRRSAEMNDAIAVITQEHQPHLEGISQRIDTLQEGVQAWCEAHRVELCGENDRLGKTANFITGTVSWRQRPPSIAVRGADAVIEALRRLKLDRFIRTKEEVNKEAMLNEPDVARGIAGIKLVTGMEDFIVQPHEVKTEV
jgi:phage host-nuclease inhibitor protein Gam